MPKFDSKLFWKSILTISLAVLGDSIMRELDLLQFGSPIVRAVYFIIALVVSGGIVQFSWVSIEKLLIWNKSPKPKNISLSYLPLTNNEIRLKIKNLEFRKPQVIISKVEIGISGQKDWLSVIHNNSALKFLKSVEVPFIKLNPKENTFSIIYPDNEVLEKFGFGVYKFDVVIQYGFSTPREGLLSRYVVVVEFGGGVLKIVSLQAPAT
ncbi:MAG: hypothetical protein Q8L64_07070 [bacterium]|jgi:hypothetical protein|nr:hypothetical protein [bacterium]MDP1951462.1 hypothetical protein [Nitrosomonas sp.]